jgi:RimJ/RimL family protein N-acetyltransferase
MTQKIVRRQVEGTDGGRIDQLVHEYRLATTARAHLTTWRLRLLLSSRVWDSKRDAAIWENGSKDLVAFAMLWSRRPDAKGLILEYVLDPIHCKLDLLNDLVGWAVRRGIEMADTANGALRIYAAEHRLISCPQVGFRGLGFVEMKPDPDRHAVFFERILRQPVHPANLQPGYATEEIAAAEAFSEYDQLYEFTSVSDAFRRHALTSDEYTHLVISDPQSAYVAYCEYSISREEWGQPADRIAWIHYVGTKEAEQGKGLATSILLKALANLRGLGATSAMLVTTSDNTPAIRVYENTGFIPVDAEPQRHFWIELRP